MTAIQTENAIKRFKNGSAVTTVLKGIDLSVNSGELTLLMGPSGCGKTTLISILAGLLTADEGKVHVFGEDLVKMSSRELTRFRGKNLGFVFQQFNLMPFLDAAENVSLPLVIQGETPGLARAKAEDMLERVGLSAQIHQRPTRLSGGQQQRVAIARALVGDPRLLVCDEPTASLDADSGKTVMSLIKSTATAKDRSVIVVTHDERILPYADRVIRMNDGMISSVEEL